MNKPINKITTDALDFLNPKERVALILRYQNEELKTGRKFTREISLTQSRMPESQRKEYADKAFTVIFANRIIFETFLSLTKEFYQLFSNYFLVLHSYILNPKMTDEKLCESNKLYKEGLIEIYQNILGCCLVEEEIGSKIGIKDILYPIYHKYFVKEQENLYSYLQIVVEEKNIKPNLEIKRILVNEILIIVNKEFNKI